jgi:hypothetical protein
VPNDSIKNQTDYRNKLPLTTLPLDYGKIIRQKGNEFTILLNKNVTILLNIEKEDNHQVNYIEYYKNGNLLFKWKDVIETPFRFIRYIGKSTLFLEDCMNGDIVLYKLVKKTSGITKITPPQEYSTE